MPQPNTLFVRARSLGRALAASVLAAAVVTCDSPTAIERLGSVSVTPSFSSNVTQVQFAGLVLDQARITIVRPPSDTIARRNFTFAPESTQLNARIDVTVEGTGDSLDAWIELLAGGTVVFSGMQPVWVVPGPPPPGKPPIQIPVNFVGPGAQVATLTITPSSTSLFFGENQQFTVAAMDSSQQAVATFYAGWTTTDTAHRITALGRLDAGNRRGAFWVIAHTPTGIRDSARVTVSPVASAIAIVSGNGQSGTVGTLLALPLVVRVTAADNGPVAGVDVAFSAQTGGGSVTTANVVTDTLGIAATTVTLGAAVGAQTFRASAGSAGQVTFTVNALPTGGTPTTILKVAGDGQSGPVGGLLPISPRVRVVDALGARIGGVQVAFAVTAGGGSVGSPTATTDTAGYAQTDWILGTATGANAMTATLPAFPGVAAVTFAATATPSLPAILLTLPSGSVPMGGTAPLEVTLEQPAPAGGVVVTVTSDSTQYATVAAPGTVTIAASDSVGSVDIIGGANPGVTFLRASATGYAPAFLPVAVTPNILTVSAATVAPGQSTAVTITAIPAPASNLAVAVTSTDSSIAAVLTPNVTILGGQSSTTATIQGVSFGVAVILATASGYVQGGNAVTVYGVAANLILVSGGNQTAPPSTTLPQPVVVMVTDTLGNPVPGYPVSFAVATGGGSVGTASTTSDAFGLASTTWTLGSGVGVQTITVTAVGLVGSPLMVAANAPAIAATVITPPLDTITAINGTTTLVAQARDSVGGNVAGSFTWTSLTPSVATVGPTGVVRAVTNGTTLIVATEAGGTADTATIVVEQRIASINVTPSVRSLYLTTSFPFAAQAVDGLGTPLPTQPSFTWSTTAPAVATVDTAGLVTGVGLGSAQIRATSGAVIGVSNVSVITAITRIAVVVDTVGAAVTDTFTLTSLGLTRRYRAIAHDTIDNVMSGLSFTWVSTNGSVAVMNTTTGDTASVTSAANGLTQIRATAQGFTSNPGAQLTVAQALNSIELTPAAATIAVNGSVAMVARGKDANNRYIPGGTFTFASSNAAIATVNASTGVVTGVANGVDTVTATSGAITSNPAVITVGGAVPRKISFGRDTLSVGRGSSTPIPIYLSTPDTVALTVNLSVADTVAFWSTASVTIPAGQTSVNATLNGRNAGTTTVMATDGSGGGFAPDTAVLAVTANMNLASGSYAINATDIVTTQILLSDPSPAGGTYVTFTYGTPGIAAISPDPAFIPPGQLAADIQIRGLAGGSTTITPSAIGVNGTASNFTAYAPILQRSTSFTRLGQGQYQTNIYVSTPTYTNVAVPVTLTSSDTTVLRVPPSVTIPSGSYYAYFTTTAVGIGSATVSYASPGWTAAGTTTVEVTTPRVGVCCGGTFFTTAPQTTFSVYSQDSLGASHNRTNSLVVRVRSSDSTVMRVLDTLVIIGPNQYSTTARIIPGGLVGTAYVIATASGHTPDSVLYTTQGPPLSLSWNTRYIGAGQEDLNSVYVSTPNNVTQPLVVTLTNPDSMIADFPDSVIIPAGLYYAYFPIRGLAPGSVRLRATAPGFAPDSAIVVVTTPRLVLSGGGTLNNFTGQRTFTAYVTDSLGNGHNRIAPLTVTFATSDTTKVRADTIATIPAGLSYASGTMTPLDTGTALIVAAAAGHGADTIQYTIQTPKLNITFTTYRIGARQYRLPTDFYVYTPDSRPDTVPVTLTQTAPLVDSLSATALTIPANRNYQYFGFAGLTPGVDTVIAAAPGYFPDTAYVTVTTPLLQAGGLPGSMTTTNPPFTGTVYSADSVGSAHYALDTVVVAVTASDPNVIRPSSAYWRLPRGAYYAQNSILVIGPGTSSITYADSAASGYQPGTTNTVTVTGPSLAISNSTPRLGMRQTGGTNSAYVYVPNAVATDLVVNLVSTDTQVVTVPASVTIPTGFNYAYFPITSRDTVGTIQIQATAVGYTGANTNVQVTVPLIVVSTSTSSYTTSPRRGITVYTADANGTAHVTTDSVPVTLISSAPSVANIDSTTVTIAAGQYYNNAATWGPGAFPGTSRIEGQDQRAVPYAYTTGFVDVAVLTPYLNLSWTTRALGIGQYDDYAYVTTPDNQSAPLAVSFAHAGTPRTATYANLTTTPITGVTISTGTNSDYFRLAGTSAGTDTLVASATSPAHTSDTAFTTVSLGRTDPLNGLPSVLNVGDSVLVTLYARDQNQGAHYVLNNETFTLAPNASIAIHVGGATVTQVTIPAGQQYVQFYIVGVAVGTGSVTITNANYSTSTPTLTVQ
jgi:uncharacterized protein YjdB